MKLKFPDPLNRWLISLRGRVLGQGTPLRRAWVYYRKYRRRIRWSLFVIFHVLGLLSSIDAIMQTRTSQGAIAWAVSLNTFPYIAVPAYWVFGHNDFQDYSEARQRLYAEQGESQNALPELGVPHPLALSGLEPGRVTLEKVAGFPAVTGNEVELLIDGDPIMDAMCEAISQAEDYVLVQFYILHGDATGKRLSKCLQECTSRGVKVCVLYDNYGSLKTPAAFFDAMRDQDVEVLAFKAEREGPIDFEVNYRNHRKLVVIDGHTAFVGGMNIGDEYLSDNEAIGYWRDTHMKVRGAVVPFLQSHFACDWQWASGEALEGLSWEPQTRTTATGAGAGVLAIGTGPDDELERCSLMFQAAIHAAKGRLWITTPYFAPDQSVSSALALAAMRGVDVRILIPHEGDSAPAHYASYSYIPQMEKAGVKVFRYTKGVLHQKVVLVDSDLAIIGSANFDNRSFRLNFELGLAVWNDVEFIGEVEAMLEADFEESYRASAEDIEEESFLFRFKSRFFRLLAPIN